MLKAGGIINIILAVIILIGLVFIKYFNTLEELPGSGAGIQMPYYVMITAFLIFAVSGIYGLSGGGMIRELPFVRNVNIAFGLYFIYRTLYLIVSLVMSGGAGMVFLWTIFFTALLGFLFTAGGLALPKKDPGRQQR